MDENQEEKDKFDMMKSNNEKSILIPLEKCLYSISFFVLTTFLFLLLSCQNNTSMPSIAIPDTDQYRTAIETIIPELQKTINIKNLAIKHYANKKELEKFFRNASKENLLFAIIPMDDSYNIRNLVQEHLFMNIGRIPDTQIPQPYIRGLSRVLGTPETVMLPLMVDTWVLLSKKDSISTRPEYRYALAGKEDDSALVSLSLALLDEKAEITDESFQSTLKEISKLANNMTFQPNAFSYTQKDARTMLLEGKALYNPILLSKYIELDFSERTELRVESLEPRFITNMTAVAFPAHATEKTAEMMLLLLTKLLDKDIQMKFAESFRQFPAHVLGPAQTAAVDRIRRQIPLQDYCIIPSMPLLEETTPPDLLEKIRGSLSTERKNMN